MERDSEAFAFGGRDLDDGNGDADGAMEVDS